MDELNLIPLHQNNYWYCCAFPVSPVRAWTPSLQQRRASAPLLEYDLEGDVTQKEGWQLAHEQAWPSGAIQNARLAGAKGLKVLDGVPHAGAAILIPPLNTTIHYLTLGFPAGASSVPIDAWREIRAAVIQSLIPPQWPGGTSCDAILHVNEADLAFLLTSNDQLLLEWIGDLLALRFRALAGPSPLARAARAETARWVLHEGEKRGLRLADVLVVASLPREAVLRIRGAWGRDPQVALTVGDKGGPRFDESLVVSAW